MNQKNLQMACFALAEDVPGLTPEVLKKALAGIAGVQDEIWLTKKETAKMLGVGPITLNRHRGEWGLRWTRMTYKNVRYAKSTVLARLHAAELGGWGLGVKMGVGSRELGG